MHVLAYHAWRWLPLSEWSTQGLERSHSVLKWYKHHGTRPDHTKKEDPDKPAPATGQLVHIVNKYNQRSSALLAGVLPAKAPRTCRACGVVGHTSRARRCIYRAPPPPTTAAPLPATTVAAISAARIAFSAAVARRKDETKAKTAATKAANKAAKEAKKAAKAAKKAAAAHAPAAPAPAAAAAPVPAGGGRSNGRRQVGAIAAADGLASQPTRVSKRASATAPVASSRPAPPSKRARATK